MNKIIEEAKRFLRALKPYGPLKQFSLSRYLNSTDWAVTQEGYNGDWAIRMRISEEFFKRLDDAGCLEVCVVAGQNIHELEVQIALGTAMDLVFKDDSGLVHIKDIGHIWS